MQYFMFMFFELFHETVNMFDYKTKFFPVMSCFQPLYYRGPVQIKSHCSHWFFRFHERSLLIFTYSYVASGRTEIFQTAPKDGFEVCAFCGLRNTLPSPASIHEIGVICHTFLCVFYCRPSQSKRWVPFPTEVKQTPICVFNFSLIDFSKGSVFLLASGMLFGLSSGCCLVHVVFIHCNLL